MRKSNVIKTWRELWEDRFSSKGYAYGTKPNAWIKDVLEGIEPSTILFAGEGEGRNAVWAAEQGWQVKAFDLTQAGRKKALELAATRGVEIDYWVQDIVDLNPLDHNVDVVAHSFLHLSPEVKRVHIPKLLHALRPGGSLISESYHTSQLGRNSGGPQSIEMLHDLDVILSEYLAVKGIKVKQEHAEVATVMLDESDLHRGEARVVRLHLRRELPSDES